MHCPRLYYFLASLPSRWSCSIRNLHGISKSISWKYFLLLALFFPKLFLLFVHANKFNDYMTKRRRRSEVFLSCWLLWPPTQTAKHPKVGNNNNKWFYRFGRKTIKNKDAGGRSLKVCSFELAQQSRLTPFRSEIGRNVLFCFHRSYGSAGGEWEREWN